MSQQDISTQAVGDAIRDILSEYGKVVFEATSQGLDAGAKTAIKLLKNKPPYKEGEGNGGHLTESWRARKGKWALSRYVGNTKKVKGRNNDVSLINVMEYSKTRSRPFVKKTEEENAETIARAVIEEVVKKV